MGHGSSAALTSDCYHANSFDVRLGKLVYDEGFKEAPRRVEGIEARSISVRRFRGQANEIGNEIPVDYVAEHCKISESDSVRFMRASKKQRSTEPSQFYRFLSIVEKPRGGCRRCFLVSSQKAKSQGR